MKLQKIIDCSLEFEHEIFTQNESTLIVPQIMHPTNAVININLASSW